MARPTRFLAFAWLIPTAACATAVDETGGGLDDGGGPSSGVAGQAGGGASTAGGQQMTTAGRPAGGQSGAFGGTNTSGAMGGDGANGQTGGSGAGVGGNGAGGASGAGSGGMVSGTSGSSGSGAGGKGTSGSGNGGGAGTMPTAGTSGTSSAGTNSGGTASGGSGTGGGSSGDCAPDGSGWVVQFWTATAATDLPTGDLRIFNNAGGTVDFSTLELRYYITNEETAELSAICATFGHNMPGPPYYEDENCANALTAVVPLTPIADAADQYIRIKFSKTPGTFKSGESARVGFYGALSMYPKKTNQANDYSYMGHPSSDPGGSNQNNGWDRVTLHVGGKLVWGCEP